MVGLVAVGCVLCAHRARPLARLPYRRGAPPPRTSRAQTWARLRCTNGGALAGVPHGRGAYRLAPSHQPHRLALLWHRTALHRGALHPSVRRLCIVGEYRVTWWGVHGLALGVCFVRGANPGGIPYPVVPRRLATVSSVAACGMGGHLRSRAEHARVWFHAGLLVSYTPLR